MVEAGATVIDVKTKHDFDQFLVNSGGRTAVIHFWASWSEPCQQLNENITLLASECEDSKVVFGKIEAENVPEVSLAYKIVAVPTIVFVNSGETVDRIDGYHPVELTQKVRQHCSGIVPVWSQKPVAPISAAQSKKELNERLKCLISQSRCVLFMKGDPKTPQCGFSRQVVQLLDETEVDYSTFDILTDDAVRQGLKEFSDWPTYPQLYLDGELVGGLDVIREELQSSDFAQQLPKKVSLHERLHSLTHKAPVMVFMKGDPSQPKCKFSRALMDILIETGVQFDHFDILSDEEVRQGLKEYSKWPTYPQVYAKGQLVGGIDVIKQLNENNELQAALTPS